jgi:hypothetical protein
MAEEVDDEDNIRKCVFVKSLEEPSRLNRKHP